MTLSMTKNVSANSCDLYLIVESLRNNGVRILSKDHLELDDSSNITTSVISQSDDTTSAPLFIQTSEPDHLVSPELLESASSGGNPHDDALRFRLPVVKIIELFSGFLRKQMTFLFCPKTEPWCYFHNVHFKPYTYFVGIDVTNYIYFFRSQLKQMRRHDFPIVSTFWKYMLLVGSN